MSDPVSGPDQERDDALQRDLLAYLREHPHAMDSVEGIAAWWLPRHQVRVAVESVTRALDTLASRGLLEPVADGDRMLYRLRPEARDGGSAPAEGSEG